MNNQNKNQTPNEGVTDNKYGLRNNSRTWRALMAYWILGVCNNYGYVVMLTAASDIIGTNETTTPNNERNCTYMSTGAILLADILPSLLVKLLAPFLPFLVHFRVALCVTLASLGFLLVAFSETIIISLLGVVATSFCSGLGEVTYLQYSSYFDKNVVSTWSSGTGAAGVIGALSYSLLQELGLQTTLLIMLIVPLIMALVFWILLPVPHPIDQETFDRQKPENNEGVDNHRSAFKEKIEQLPELMKFIIPFALVYLFEYFINQGTFELINIKNSLMEQKDLYRWLLADYQIGVFISRSSVNFFHIKHTWILAVLQFVNVLLFTSEAIFYYIPSIWIILALTLWEGLLGGCAYVPSEKRPFSMAITGFGDSIGITFAGIFAIIVHNKICSLPLPSHF